MKNVIVNKTLDKYGCVTPYLGPKEMICKNKETAKKAFEDYQETKMKAVSDEIPECPRSCEFVMIDFGRFSSTTFNCSEDENPCN